MPIRFANVRNRRYAVAAGHSRERLLTEPAADFARPVMARQPMPQTRHPPAAHNVVTRPAYVAMFGAPTRSARHSQPTAAISKIWSARVLSRN